MSTYVIGDLHGQYQSLKHMTEDPKSYKWTKIKNGIGYVAIVNIEVFPNLEGTNEINEHYNGIGFTSQGYIEEVSAKGYDDWKAGARSGLKYGFSLVDRYSTVQINKIEGLTSDTNPTIVGYTILRAFLDSINHELDNDQIRKLEEFVLCSWTKPNHLLIPNFFTLSFETISIQ
ncbi:hypothetical protein A4H97_09735 [Niastella yeongjuensis]|uniref:Uncharacterized protein n=1 Tax=Niastella yeongjuensis TaxID=354355 RepID=A0A1V9EER4_9BACT|nr:hypothetical protein [Niastella yeongjuensis]OQP44637.1 hypothetical protein A4H97_09735 [Niastella yeongjuensis]SEO80421.1 hypothetical protein SAMN05660816_03595 [Niastella yeongjuensis]